MLPQSWLRINYNGKILRQWSHRLVPMSPSPWELSIVILLPTAMLHTVFNHGWSNFYQIFYLVHLYFAKWLNNAMRLANKMMHDVHMWFKKSLIILAAIVRDESPIHMTLSVLSCENSRLGMRLRQKVLEWKRA